MLLTVEEYEQLILNGLHQTILDHPDIPVYTGQPQNQISFELTYAICDIENAEWEYIFEEIVSVVYRQVRRRGWQYCYIESIEGWFDPSEECPNGFQMVITFIFEVTQN